MPLRIVQVDSCDLGWGGTEVHLVRLSQGLKAAGHEVQVMCRPDSFIEKQCRENGIAPVPVDVRRRGDVKKLPELVRLMRRFRPHVVHVHTPFDIALFGAAAIMAGVPARICTRHGGMPFKNRTSPWAYGKMYHRFIAVSDYARRRNLPYGLPGRKFRVVYPGLDKNVVDLRESMDSMRARLELPGGFVASIIGRISEEKGHEVFLRALALLEKRGAPVKGLIVGDGPLRENLEKLEKELGLTSLLWAGYRPNVLEYMRASDAIVIPSVITDAFPWVLLEAMAVARPVVASDIGGIKEGIQEGVTGFVTKSGDPEPLAEKLAELAADTAKAEQMGAAGYSLLAERFSPEVFVENTVRVYEEVLGKR